MSRPKGKSSKPSHRDNSTGRSVSFCHGGKSAKRITGTGPKAFRHQCLPYPVNDEHFTANNMFRQSRYMGPRRTHHCPGRPPVFKSDWNNRGEHEQYNGNYNTPPGRPPNNQWVHHLPPPPPPPFDIPPPPAHSPPPSCLPQDHPSATNISARSDERVIKHSWRKESMRPPGTEEEPERKLYVDDQLQNMGDKANDAVKTDCWNQEKEDDQYWRCPSESRRVLSSYMPPSPTETTPESLKPPPPHPQVSAPHPHPQVSPLHPPPQFPTPHQEGGGMYGPSPYTRPPPSSNQQDLILGLAGHISRKCRPDLQAQLIETMRFIVHQDQYGYYADPKQNPWERRSSPPPGFEAGDDQPKPVIEKNAFMYGGIVEADNDEPAMPSLENQTPDKNNNRGLQQKSGRNIFDLLVMETKTEQETDVPIPSPLDKCRSHIKFNIKNRVGKALLQVNNLPLELPKAEKENPQPKRLCHLESLRRAAQMKRDESMMKKKNSSKDLHSRLEATRKWNGANQTDSSDTGSSAKEHDWFDGVPVNYSKKKEEIITKASESISKQSRLQDRDNLTPPSFYTGILRTPSVNKMDTDTPGRWKNNSSPSPSFLPSPCSGPLNKLDCVRWKSPIQKRYECCSVKFIDTHCHLDFLFDRLGSSGSYENYRKENAATYPHNYGGCVTIFCDPRSFKPDNWQFKQFLSEENVWGAVGCHPKSATDFGYQAAFYMQSMLKHEKVKAVGEIGLDYSSTFRQSMDTQKRVFKRQLKMALDIQKPIVIHCRDAEQDCLDIMEEMVPANHAIHRHCFTGCWEEASVWLDKFPNSYIGLTPLVTWLTHRSKPVREVASRIPLERLLLETDAPYFLPHKVDKEMRFSHPGFAITVAEVVSTLQGVPLDMVLAQCLKNSIKMYDLDLIS